MTGSTGGRCAVCRARYRADVRVGERQRVCSKKCSKKRRREQARQRREQDVDEYRAAERERQSACRERRAGSARAAPSEPSAPSKPSAPSEPSEPSAPESHAASAGGEPDKAVPVAVSRAEFGSQEPEISKELLILWDQQARLSRADFVRKIGQLLGSRGVLLGSLGS